MRLSRFGSDSADGMGVPLAFTLILALMATSLGSGMMLAELGYLALRFPGDPLFLVPEDLAAEPQFLLGERGDVWSFMGPPLSSPLGKFPGSLKTEHFPHLSLALKRHSEFPNC